MASGWFVDSVEVKVNNDTTMFPVGRWLDKQEDDGKISLELEPNKKPASKAATGKNERNSFQCSLINIISNFRTSKTSI